MTTVVPALVGIAHGTSSADGQSAVAALMASVAEANPELTVALGFVDVQHPDTEETLESLPDGLPAIVVPLLLSAGYHVHVDLARAVRAATGRATRLTGALGPDERLTAMLLRRLAEIGFGPDDALVLAVAGSSDARAVADCRVVSEQLAAASGHPVTIGFLSAAEPRLADAIATARASHGGGRVVVSSYLLAPGFFHTLAQRAGADAVSSPLLVAHEPTPGLLVEVVVDRYRELRPSG